MGRANRTGVRGLYKDKNGRHRIDLRWTDAKTGTEYRHKEVLPPGTTAGAARTRAQAVLADALAGRPHKSAATGQVSTLAQAFDEYRRLNPGNNPKQRERHCKQLLELIGDVPLSDVNELAIARYARDRSAMTRANKNAKKASAEKVSTATVNRELQTLGAFFTSAVEWGWIESRPKIRLLKEPPGRVRWLSDAEREKLYGALPIRFKRVVAAAALSGQRLANVLSLTRDRVDLQHKTLSIPKTKSGKRHDVPISEPLAAILREAIVDGDVLAKDAEQKPTHVFLSRHRVPYTSSGVSGLFRKVAKRAGVKDFHFHDLRHDFATRIRRAGHGLDVVQELLGHASPVMTQRYAHIGRDELHAAVGAAAFAPVLPPAKKKNAKKVRKKR